ncbi:DUF4259 domain-containing protein [Alteraurantiacibacter aquimixticola]|uniref:DUF4259 domain-containing protein n=1 Tax=Alteraurantiacibacter aquimixticola TaxID=2489173 RepID=A0A4V4U8Y4_9SPHN|nr:DUF4259 domain-containing protein [Alteraurantiacibacter aquimixticola]TIX51847.1 DUF4259 domain-containing protein [Alteraurantiacibacter aquimixticola]
MGAWGLLFDENDDAADWLAGFADAPDWSAVDDAFALDEDYVEAPEASNALAAAEVVAAAIGNASPRLKANVGGWASDQPDQGNARREIAIKAVKRVRDDSELSELWEETDEFEDWKKSVDETIARL